MSTMIKQQSAIVFAGFEIPTRNSIQAEVANDTHRRCQCIRCSLLEDGAGSRAFFETRAAKECRVVPNPGTLRNRNHLHSKCGSCSMAALSTQTDRVLSSRSQLVSSDHDVAALPEQIPMLWHLIYVVKDRAMKAGQ